MRLSQIVVEVRDLTLTRVGTITAPWLDLRATIVHCGVGSWQLRLPADHDMAPALRTPGAGIVVTGETDVLLSGPVDCPVVEAGADEPSGLLTVTGATDDVLAADALAWPQPSNPDVATQAEGHDVRSGYAAHVMAGYVSANIGPAAPPARRGALARRLVVAPVAHLGPVVTRSARFDQLDALLTQVAAVAGMGWRIVQRGDDLVFETHPIDDRTATVRLSVRSGGLASQTVAVSAPGVTHVVVAGQGQLEERTLLLRTSTDSLAAAEAWGRQIERFKDQRQTDDLVELQQAADADLAGDGFTATNVAAVPSDQTAGMRYGVDWHEGDRVTVVVDGQETTALATSATLVADSAGVRTGITLGDPTGFDPQAATARRVEDTARRVAALEANAENGPATLGRIDASAITSGTLPPARIGDRSIARAKLLVPVPAGGNLVEDHQFAVNLTGGYWGVSPASWSAVTGLTATSVPPYPYPNGPTTAARLAAVAGTQTVRYGPGAARPPSDDGAVYRASVWVYATVAQPAGALYVGAQRQAATGAMGTASYSFGTTAAVPAGTWTKVVTNPYTMPIDTAALNPIVGVTTANAGGDVYFTDLQLVRGVDRSLVGARTAVQASTFATSWRAVTTTYRERLRFWQDLWGTWHARGAFENAATITVMAANTMWPTGTLPAGVPIPAYSISALAKLDISNVAAAACRFVVGGTTAGDYTIPAGQFGMQIHLNDAFQALNATAGRVVVTVEDLSWTW